MRCAAVQPTGAVAAHANPCLPIACAHPTTAAAAAAAAADQLISPEARQSTEGQRFGPTGWMSMVTSLVLVLAYSVAAGAIRIGSGASLRQTSPRW